VNVKLSFPSDYPEEEWIERGHVTVTVRHANETRVLNFYNIERLVYEANASSEYGRAWADSNVVVLADLTLASLERHCEVFACAGFVGLLPEPSGSTESRN
jgi:hypothetical protein